MVDNTEIVGGVEIADLDALISEPLTFRLHGKVRKLEPIRNITYLKFVHGLNKLYKDLEDQSINDEQYQKTVLELFQTVCPELSFEDISQCTRAQVAALFSLVVDHINGRAGSLLEADKKKIVHH